MEELYIDRRGISADDMIEDPRLMMQKNPLEFSSEGGSIYFVFVEDIETISCLKAIDIIAADDSINECEFHWDDKGGKGKKLKRIRTSGVKAIDMLGVITKFERLVTGQISEEQRVQRRKNLITTFWGGTDSQPSENIIKLPVIDIYGCSLSKDYKKLEGIIKVGNWYVVIFNEEYNNQPVMLQSLREVGKFENMNSIGLNLVASLNKTIKERLEDIFSLNHVKDAVIMREEDGVASAAMPKPELPSPLAESSSDVHLEQNIHEREEESLNEKKYVQRSNTIQEENYSDDTEEEEQSDENEQVQTVGHLYE